VEALDAVLNSVFGGVIFLLHRVHDGLDSVLELLAGRCELALEGCVFIVGTALSFFGVLLGQLLAQTSLLLAALALDLLMLDLAFIYDSLHFSTAQPLLCFLPELFLLSFSS